MTNLVHLVQPMLSYLKDAALLGLIAAYLRIVEIRAPIQAKMPAKDIIADWMLVGVTVGMTALFAPLVAACSGYIVSAAGGGFIKLRTDGPWYFVSLAVVVIAIDFYKYWFHRMEHAIPFLWELHSFHHSAESVTFITGARHHWIERVLTAAVLPIIPIIFKTPPSLDIIAGVITFLPDTCSHTNVRLELGRAATWFNNPQWHRIHHSALLEHRDKNFASFLTLWDFLFGTAYVAAPGEYPPTGLDPREEVGLIEGLVWPFRKYLGRFRTGAPLGGLGAAEVQ
jgi:sterol desaturase/sphingolipid hydroxylase (fatty acid hydroxylase superfamily)